MKNIIPFVLIVLLAGCATSRAVVGQDGKTVHKISCDGMALKIDACFEKAGELCGSAGYDIVSQDANVTPIFAPGVYSAYVSRTVMARCRSL